MPSKNQNQLNFFLLVQGFRELGDMGMYRTHKLLKGFKPKLTPDYVAKIEKTAAKIKDADLRDKVSGIEGQNPLGDNRTILVGFWALFRGKYRDRNNNIKEGEFIGQITKVDNKNKIANFNQHDMRNKFGVRTELQKRADITHGDFLYLDFAHFSNIIKTGKTPQEVAITKPASDAIREQIQKIFWSTI